jgi:SAM-dependent methyltransferase
MTSHARSNESTRIGGSAVANKFEFFTTILHSYANSLEARGTSVRLLDVGCRGCELKPYVSKLAHYEGADLVQNSQGTVDFVGDIEKGIPASAAHYDFVVALDVVEHLEDPVAALDELLRVTRGHLFVMIPNMCHWAPRSKFFFTGRISEKYDFVFPPPRDRHRWLTTMPQSDKFFADYAARRGLTLATHWTLDGRRKTQAARILRMLRVAPSLWVWASLYVLTRQSHAHATAA